MGRAAEACMANNLYVHHLADVLLKNDLQSVLVLHVNVMLVQIRIRDKSSL